MLDLLIMSVQECDDDNSSLINGCYFPFSAQKLFIFWRRGLGVGDLSFLIQGSVVQIAGRVIQAFSS